ncbi:MAG: M23 family metallopeptidase [Alphaproteobacteria bacterium]|nr:M23 family metallopeptidase [Alphaproteobacteria bacterium]MCD8571343.1 M23 family metallopeptidase [Alphaproteobacteria bacterium]
MMMLSGCLGTQKPAPVTAYGGSAGSGSTGTHVVEKGDTLYTIASRYHIVMSDIAVVNNLQAPFVLNQGQRLKLPPPQEYKVREGDSLYLVSRLYSTSTAEIARLNNLSAPYAIQAGQILRLPSGVRRDESGITHEVAVAEAAPVGGVEREDLSSSPLRATASGPADTPMLKTSGSGKFSAPVKGPILSSYGSKPGGLHNDGINIKAPRGTPVGSADAGQVVYAGNELKGSGNLVLVRHSNGYMTAYAHLDRIDVKRGMRLARGQQLGTVGSTGSVSSPQLHFEVRKGTEAMNPQQYL